MSSPNQSIKLSKPASCINWVFDFLRIPAGFFWANITLLALFGLPLFNLFSFAINSDLYSYILIIPLIVVYFFRLTPRSTSPNSGKNIPAAATLAGAGLTLLLIQGAIKLTQLSQSRQDSIALLTLTYVFFVGASAAWFLDGHSFRGAVFPLCFLLFLVPFPTAVEHAIESFLQHGSAPPALWFLKLAGTPVYQQGLVFQLPGMTLQIAPECSGIRSTLVLFMTSLIAGYLFLRSPWKRVALTAAVVPLALLRNGFRVFVIGELCVRIGPHMIDSPIHHHGGPIFFALSLIPFSILVYLLVRSDRKPDLAVKSESSV